MASPALLFAASGAMNAIGAIHSGNSEAAAGEYNAQMAERNAALSRQQAAIEEQRTRTLAAKQIGNMRAGYGASGVAMDGSAIDVLSESAANAELDALTVRHGGEMRAQGFQNEALLDRYRAKNSKLGGYLGALGAGLSSYASYTLFSAGGVGGGGGSGGGALKRVM